MLIEVQESHNDLVVLFFGEPTLDQRLVERRRMAEATYPDDLLYHAEHDWARLDGDTATLGITWYAQDALGEVVFFDPPDVGTTITAGESYAEVESVKAVSDVIAPLSGEIVEVNEALGDSPEAINVDPYGEGWMVRIRLSDASETDGLMDQATYTAMLE
jgi:glycine cleavage system H protein